MRIDLHTHSSTSDGTDTPEQLVEQAVRARLDVVALTDHDTFDGLDAAVATGERVGIEVVRGLELSCTQGGSSVHLLGYGADPADPELAEEMARVRGGRTGRLRVRPWLRRRSRSPAPRCRAPPPRRTGPRRSGRPSYGARWPPDYGSGAAWRT